MSYDGLAPASGFFVCRFTVEPSFKVLSTRLGPVTTSVPACKPLTISISDSPVMPVVTSTNFTLLFLSKIYRPFTSFGFSPTGVGALLATDLLGVGVGGAFSTIAWSGTARTLLCVLVVIVAV